MCIAIHKPKGVTIPIAHLKESFASNPDGAGFAALHHKHGFVISKGFFTLEEFSRAYEPFENSPALVHFRIATSGGVSSEMCHPFPLCGGKYAMIHNGVLDIKPHKGKSDTATFADSVLTPLLDAGVPHTCPSFKFLVESAIGNWNKILIMDRAGKVAYFNEDKGHRLNKVWYSNDTYLPSKYTAPAKTVMKPWTDAEWAKAGYGSGRGTLLNEERLCEYCQEPLDEFNEEDYCWDCLEQIWDTDKREIALR